MAENTYPLADGHDLERITTDLTRDGVDTFYPTWYTEDWVNFRSTKGVSLTFRFERPGYIGTLVGSDQESHYFGSSHVSASAGLGDALKERDPKTTLYQDSNANDIRDVTGKIIGGKQIREIGVFRGDEKTPDYVKIETEDGSYAAVAFMPGTLIAVEHSGSEGRKVYGVEGKELGHRRLNLLASAMSGKDVTYTEPVSGEVYILPEFGKSGQKKLLGK